MNHLNVPALKRKKTKILPGHPTLFHLLYLMGMTLLTGIQSTAQTSHPLSQSQTQSSKTFPPSGKFASSNLRYKIISTPNNTFGYDIYAGNHLAIHQSSVPGLPGNNGFKIKAAAIKVAELVMQKIRKGEMPPTVTLEEMKQLKAIQ